MIVKALAGAAVSAGDSRIAAEAREAAATVPAARAVAVVKAPGEAAAETAGG